MLNKIVYIILATGFCYLLWHIFRGPAEPYSSQTETLIDSVRLADSLYADIILNSEPALRENAENRAIAYAEIQRYEKQARMAKAEYNALAEADTADLCIDIKNRCDAIISNKDKIIIRKDTIINTQARDIALLKDIVEAGKEQVARRDKVIVSLQADLKHAKKKKRGKKWLKAGIAFGTGLVLGGLLFRK